MAAPLFAPPADIDPTARKRVCKACDRCRLKKSKCDGASPCNRCRTDNSICMFGERKKSLDRTYPKGLVHRSDSDGCSDTNASRLSNSYVEMLEQQQSQLVAGLQALYGLVIKSEGWQGDPLNESNKGHPLTHDILERLGALKADPTAGTEVFEEDLDHLRERCSTERAKRPRNSTTASDAHTQTPSSESFPTYHHLPPTPTPSPDEPLPGHVEYTAYVPSHVMSSVSLNPSVLQSPQQTWVQQHPPFYDERLDYLRFDPPANTPVNPAVNSSVIPAAASAMQESANPCLPVSTNWLEDELSPFASHGHIKRQQ